jgi:hypothetical protein
VVGKNRCSLKGEETFFFEVNFVVSVRVDLMNIQVRSRVSMLSDCPKQNEQDCLNLVWS